MTSCRYSCDVPHTCVVFTFLFLGISILAQVNGCPMGYYGEGCRSSCAFNCISLECEPLTGECLGGCKDGFTGILCNSTCPEGMYGLNCSQVCPLGCPDSICDHITGACNTSCAVGYTGIHCDLKCKAGFFGEGCSTNCSENCADQECHHESGYCLNGCLPGYWGSDCSLLGEFEENPEPTKQKFYRQLSAESKSVLLYILMSRYEATLERAQMEVKNGVRQRNELKELIGNEL